MNEKQKAVEYFEKNRLKYVCPLECVKHDNIEFLYSEKDGVFLFDESAKIHMLATDSPEVCALAAREVENVDLLLCHNAFEFEFFKDKFHFSGCNKCYQAVWTKGKIPLSGVCEIKRFEPTEENIDIVFKNYTLGFERERIAFLMREFGVYGAFVNGSLAGFMGRHEERSMGLLEVFPPFRRRGIGTELENFLINDLLTRGETPFAHVICDNVGSLELHRKSGFSFYDGFVYWLY